ncbi:hypothetical protein Tco_0153026 [Tanacetum coccineum]
MRTMPRRPRKNRIKAQSENNSQVSKVGRKMTCTNCQEIGHNKSSCKIDPVPKLKVNRPPVLKPLEYGTYASARGRGRGSKGGRGGFGSRGEGTTTMGRGRGSRGGRGRRHRGRGRGQRGRGRGQMLRDKKEMTKDEIRKNLEHEYMEEMLLQEEQKFDANQAQQDEFDQEALRKMDYFHPSNWTQEEESFEVEPYNRNLITVDANVQTQESVAANISDRGEIEFRLGDFKAEDNYKSNADLEIPIEEPIASVTPSADKWKQLAEPSKQPELQPQAIKI